MAQRKQVHPGLHRDARMGRQQRGRLDQAVGAVAVGEADVVADGEVIHTRRHRALGELVQPARPGAQILLAQDDPDLDRAGWGWPASPYVAAARFAVAVAAACRPNTSAQARPPA